MRILFTFLALMIPILFGGVVFGQTGFPCGFQDLTVCEPDCGVATLIADSSPCVFNSGEAQLYLLVDENNATVNGDLDNSRIIQVSSSGIFVGIPTGDYAYYSLTYDAAYASEILPDAQVGDAIFILLGSATAVGPGTFISNDPPYVLEVSPLVTVNGPSCDCGSTGITPEANIIVPCACLNNATNSTNGQFSEVVEVTSNPGETWTVVAQTGAYALTSPSPPAAPTALALGSVLTENPAGSGHYQIHFLHVDAIGYTMNVSNGTFTLFQSATCFYPDATITGLSDTYCTLDAPTVLTSSASTSGTSTFTIDGMAATSLNPAILGVGTHTVVLTFDATDATNTTNPGCITTVTRNVTIVDDCIVGQYGTISGVLYNDVNGNGVQDPGEQLYAGILVTLYDAITNEPVAQVYTDLNGNFIFPSTPYGMYYINIDLPSNIIPAVGSGIGLDGNSINFTLDENNASPAYTIELVSAPNTDYCDFVAFFVNTSCTDDGEAYYLNFTLQGPPQYATQGYTLSSNANIIGVYYSSFVLGPFDNGTGYSYTLTSIVDPSCVKTISKSKVECLVTPIQLISFKGENAGSQNYLTWSTGTEENVKYFNLNRSFDGENFDVIATINSEGYSNTVTNYDYFDSSFQGRSAYYQLSFTDLSGGVHIASDIILISREAVAGFQISNLYPVPVTDLLNIDYITEIDQEVHISIFDIGGKLITTHNTNATAGINTVSVDMHNLPSGTYILRIENGAEVVNKKFTRQ